MKESLKKITTWIKAHPWAAGILAVILVILAYFAIKSGGNSSGESLGLDNSNVSADPSLNGSGDPFSGLTGSTTVTPAPAISASPVDSFPSISGSGSAPAFDSSIASGFDPSIIPTSGIFSGPTSAESVISMTASEKAAGAGWNSKPFGLAAAVTSAAAAPKIPTPTPTPIRSGQTSQPVKITSGLLSGATKTGGGLIGSKPKTTVLKSPTRGRIIPPSPGAGYIFDPVKWVWVKGSLAPTIRTGGRTQSGR